LSKASEIVYSHHERYDGKGYPRGLAGEAIPLGARIFAVADTLDAMTSDRPYRKAMTWETARDEIARNSGTQFDPHVVKVFLELFDEWIANGAYSDRRRAA
jgi:HD-GYP domain-containing protein (c-di-GMP phosphodiesterase class II)